jgi:hypothetical protein
VASSSESVVTDSVVAFLKNVLKESFRTTARAQALIEEKFRTAIWSQLEGR